MREDHATVVVAGGGLGGVAAALAAVERGADVLLAERTLWLGGQLTSQAVPLDEHPWIERFGCTARYRALRDGIRAHYRAHYPLTEAARRSSGRLRVLLGHVPVRALVDGDRVRAVTLREVASGRERIAWADWVLD